MLVISSREFRANQKSYFDKVDEGAQIVIQRGKNKSYKLIPIKEDETLMSEEDFYAKLNRSIQQAKKGRVTRIDSLEDFKKLLGI